MSFCLIKSKLCKVALLTITHPTSTGCNNATGVIIPVLHTDNSTFKIFELTCFAGYLNAKAYFG
jgi:hypothetical protein